MRSVVTIIANVPHSGPGREMIISGWCWCWCWCVYSLQLSGDTGTKWHPDHHCLGITGVVTPAPATNTDTARISQDTKLILPPVSQPASQQQIFAQILGSCFVWYLSISQSYFYEKSHLSSARQRDSEFCVGVGRFLCFTRGDKIELQYWHSSSVLVNIMQLITITTTTVTTV